jgi:plasmid replication initiation protein
MVTYSRNRHSLIGTRVLYWIIDQLQKLRLEYKGQATQDLFGKVEVHLNVAEIATGTHTAEVWKALKNELMVKPVKYKYKDTDDKEVAVETVIISGLKAKKGSGIISASIADYAIKYLIDFHNGYTEYQKSIALSMPSVFSQHLYELCCRWKDTGVCYLTLVEFKEIMNCTDKFERFSQLKDRVIDKAVKDINKISEWHVRYILGYNNEKKQRGRKLVTHITFFIEPKVTDKQYYYKDYVIVYNFLYSVYCNDSALKVTDWLMNNQEIVAASNVLSRVQDDVTKGKVKKHGLWNYVTAILHDLKVPADVLPARK